MKNIVLILFTSFATINSLQAQTFAEWFQQKKTQLKYLAEQIAAYQVYTGYLEKGYGIAQKGLTVIHELKNGEFDLHNAFFNSLRAVNPDVAKYSKVAGILSYQLAIIRDFKKMLQLKNISAGEMKWLSIVVNNMTSESNQSMNELIGLVTHGGLAMTDGERIQRINTIYQDMQDKYVFTQSFTADAGLLSTARAQELSAIDFLKKLPGQ
ncbi:MAG TPA: hypothetical protein VK543_12425 [Puia sp.]|nr:hypothetical protein [Puia sp.]